MTTEKIHSDFETMKRGNWTYRISTTVSYRVAQDDYKCHARLHKELAGRAYPENRKHRKSAYVSEKSEIDDALKGCIESCKEKLDKIEDAKDVSVDVSIDG